MLLEPMQMMFDTILLLLLRLLGFLIMLQIFFQHKDILVEKLGMDISLQTMERFKLKLIVEITIIILLLILPEIFDMVLTGIFEILHELILQPQSGEYFHMLLHLLLTLFLE
jgi:hypothetical protein